MNHRIISISKAKEKLLELVRLVDETGDAFVLTKDSSPVSALVPMLSYEALLETDNISGNPKLMSDLQDALEDEKKGRLWSRDAKGKWIPIKRKKKRVSGS